ncbi:MAG: DNA polymerase thumb domain-containing protein [Bilifractor sp.]
MSEKNTLRRHRSEGERIIFHVDVNSAFLSWSAVKRLSEDPGAVDLRKIPSAVGGDVRTRHGVITAKSIPAKKYGIHTGEPVVKALQKCPQLVLVPSDFATYRRYSRAFIAILKKYTDMVEQVSIDEAYMDVTALDSDRSLFSVDADRESQQDPFPISLAERLKDEIRDTLGFTVNIGISVNKLLAKTASDFTKPDRVHTLYPEEVPEKLWPMRIGELHGCGHATAQKLEMLGIHTIGDAAHADPEVLRYALGEKAGAYIYESSNGHGSDQVMAEHEKAKGYSNELTTPNDINASNYDMDMPPLLHHIAGKLSARLQKDEVYAGTIGVMVKTDLFRRRSRQLTLSVSTNAAEEIERVASDLMRELLFGRDGIFEDGYSIRLVGISATNLDHGEYRQINIFDVMQDAEAARQEKEEQRRQEEQRLAVIKRQKEQQLAALKRQEEQRLAAMKKREAYAARSKRLSQMLETVRDRYGKDSISRGIDISEKKQRN